MQEVNVQRGTDIRFELQGLFEIEAKGAQAKGRLTPERVRYSWRRLPRSLAAEVLEYAKRVTDAVARRADAREVAKINGAFEQRLSELLAHKKMEFGLEIKYNIVFTKSMEEALGRDGR